MIDAIMQAVEAECQAFGASVAGDPLGTPQIMLVTNFKDIDMATYTMPLILIYIVDAPDTSRYIGGMKKSDWQLAFGSYHYNPDADLNDLSAYPASLSIIIDLIADHFATGLTGNAWLTSSMTTIWQNYGFKVTLNGIGRADPLGKDGLLMGWKVNFDSIALSRNTSNTAISTAALQYVIQQPYP